MLPAITFLIFSVLDCLRSIFFPTLPILSFPTSKWLERQVFHLLHRLLESPATPPESKGEDGIYPDKGTRNDARS
jgi:hypothetical protein